MKRLLHTGFFALIFLSASIRAAEPAQLTDTSTVSGTVLEVRDVEQYTYLRLKTSKGETWAAVEKAAIKVGASVNLRNVMVMNNFESKSLHKTFPSIVFGSLDQGGGAVANPHGKSMATPAEQPNVKVEKAAGPNAYTVAEVVGRAKELSGKTVVVRARVTKFNAGIMDRNWIHLSDGSGDASSHNNDLLATGNADVKLGAVVEMTGTVRVDQDFGAGYAYKVLIENATIKP